MGRRNPAFHRRCGTTTSINAQTRARLFIVLFSAAGGCISDAHDNGGSDLWDAASSRPRTFASASWDTLWVLGGPEDTLLLQPAYLQADRHGVYVYEFGAGRLVALAADGRIRWSFGRLGSGPGEFSNVRDMKIDTDGKIWLYDVGNQRVTRLTPSGELDLEIRVAAAERGEQMVPVDDTTAAIFTFADTTPIVLVAESGEVLDRRTLPWPAFESLHVLQRQGVAVSNSFGWGYLLGQGNGWFVFERGGRRRTQSYVEHNPMAELVREGTARMQATRISGDASCTACSAALMGDTLVVHFGGASEQKYRLLDRYDWRTGEYLSTIVLPLQVPRVTVYGDRVYVLYLSGYPTLMALRYRVP